MARRLLRAGIWLAGTGTEGREVSRRQAAITQEIRLQRARQQPSPAAPRQARGGARCAALVLGGVLQHYDAAACVDQASRQRGAETRALGTPVGRAMLWLDASKSQRASCLSLVAGLLQ